MSEVPEGLRSISNGKILLSKLLGKGGFGEVYQGVQASDGTPVAVKIERNMGRNSFLFRLYCCSFSFSLHKVVGIAPNRCCLLGGIIHALGDSLGTVDPCFRESTTRE